MMSAIVVLYKKPRQSQQVPAFSLQREGSNRMGRSLIERKTPRFYTHLRVVKFSIG